MKERESLTHPYGPVFDRHSRVLVLGTFPSVKSRETGFYYGHPRNRFWQVIAGITGKPVPQTIPQKKQLLLEERIALWDVAASCDIIGSSDATITNAAPNDIGMILSACAIEGIYANGATAKRLYDALQREKCGREIVALPSTSPANAAWSLPLLVAKWKILMKIQ